MLGKGRGRRSPELLWSKDQAASRLNHRRSASRLLKLVGAPNRFQNVVAGVRTPLATLPVEIPCGEYGLRHLAGGHPLPILHPGERDSDWPGQRRARASSSPGHARQSGWAPLFSQDSIIIMSELLREKT
jgi:hypothetical protein